ncbi:MAG: putative aminohydrolase SsnA [Candidatus Thermoplasmatota archaeon]|nr:putative aminohydrolase SsnA [Candidatus Thermoplasmatota archaeon]
MNGSKNGQLLIKNGTICTMDDSFNIYKKCSLIVDEGIIKEIGPYEEVVKKISPGEAKVIDAGNKIIMPGMICAHTHFYGAFSRGMALKSAPPRNFVEILDRLWWKLDKALCEKDIFHSSLLCIADAIRHGTTTVIDHHASPNFIGGSLDTVERACRVLGIRGSLCYEVTDRNGPKDATAGIEENVRYLRKVKEKKTGIMRGSFGLHASLTLSEDTLAKCSEEAKKLGSGFHVHVAEAESDNIKSKDRYGRSVVERFHDAGILGPKTLASHCVHVSDDDIELLAKSGTHVMHNPQSNMNNAVGVAPVEKMQDAGINVGIGTDGFSHDMWREMKFVYVLHKLSERDPRRMGGDNVLGMQNHANAKIASVFWERPLGVIKKGALADIILLDYRPPTPMNSGNLPWHVQFGMDATNVTHTIIDGKIVMEDRIIKGWNPVKMAEISKKLAIEMWDRL